MNKWFKLEVFVLVMLIMALSFYLGQRFEQLKLTGSTPQVETLAPPAASREAGRICQWTGNVVLLTPSFGGNSGEFYRLPAEYPWFEAVQIEEEVILIFLDKGGVEVSGYTNMVDQLKSPQGQPCFP